ncbi:hypothetical protein [Nonomuraea dietziae]|uniref:Uncharacterized protein n=1 Tax=Nonomuraea dietziae TaxID=65515 RepID=A0A7W5V0Y2_9ACTN|nr:hypothetical protein [Nonomuraea dietziae]MBB3728356.1 hypothetical protein [Nonomuraea dietziae]
MATLGLGEGEAYRWELSNRELTLIFDSLIDSLSRNSPQEIELFFGWSAEEIQRFVDEINRQIQELKHENG